MNKNSNISLAVSLLVVATIACNAATLTRTLNQPPQTEVSPTQSQGNNSIPLTEADVPRVAVDKAKSALDGGEAIIVDVRSAEAYAAGHAAGAINIPLAEFENNIDNVPLAKDQWHHLLHLTQRAYERPCGIPAFTKWLHQSHAHPRRLVRLGGCGISNGAIANKESKRGCVVKNASSF
jgi:hypothetical protein